MRKTIIAILAFAFGCTALPAQERTDTTATKVDTVMVVTSDPQAKQKGHVHLDFDIPFYRKVRRPKAAEIGHIGAGALFAVPNGSMGFSPQNSLEFWGYAITPRTNGRHTLSYGPGITFRNLGITGNKAMTMSEDGDIVIGRFKENAVPRISKLVLCSLNLPIFYSIGFGRGYGITIGPVVNLNAFSTIVNKYTIDGDKRKDKYKNAHCNLVTVDAMVQLNLSGVSLYAKYSPMNVMDKNYWPEFTSWSAGVALTIY